MLPTVLTLLLAAGAPAPAPANDAPAVSEVSADPARVMLAGPGAVWRILVNGTRADGAEGRVIDLTGGAVFRSRDPGVATVDAAGVVRAVADGRTEIEIRAAARTLTVVVEVRDSAKPRPLHFEHDVVPVLSRFGCNAGGCHGKAEGQNGFKLSVFGFDPAADYDALVKESRGRRVFPADPDRSLLLAKAVGTIPHGGGVRLRRDSADYATLRAWIASGLPVGDPSAPRLTAIRVEPGPRVMAMRSAQQLRVIGRWADGREADVTAHARFQSNNDALATVDEHGRVTAGEAPGLVAVMASYMGAVDTFRAFVPQPAGAGSDAPDPPAANFIDPTVYKQLRRLNIRPGGPADDAEFLRRVSLDIIGTAPTADEARAFLADKSPGKRAALVDRLLARPEFADYWGLKWADVLRIDRAVLGHRPAYAFHKWVRDSLAEGKPLDRFARELIMADGPLAETGPAGFYKVTPKPGDAAGAVSQVFLGVRIGCAECHHHPFDRWSQTDYYGMAAFFAPVKVTKTARGEAVLVGGEPVTKHPRSGEPVFAHALGAPMPAADPPADRRAVLAAWLTAPDNPWFARNLANRTWAHFFGRGLVEPVDDFRATNPPTNPELLDALAGHLVESRFDLRSLIRAIVLSRTYQTTSRPEPGNERDAVNHSRALLRRLDAEVLLDMVCQATGTTEKFDGAPAGTRAIGLWDSKAGHYFLKTFGRPERATNCTCERAAEPSAAQVLHVLNSPEINGKLSRDDGAVARLVRDVRDDGRLADELYLRFLCRFPTAEERASAVAHLGRSAAKRRSAAEDLAWSLMNSLEFVFNH
jgi:hypothetical protein